MPRNTTFNKRRKRRAGHSTGTGESVQQLTRLQKEEEVLGNGMKIETEEMEVNEEAIAIATVVKIEEENGEDDDFDFEVAPSPPPAIQQRRKFYKTKLKAGKDLPPLRPRPPHPSPSFCFVCVANLNKNPPMSKVIRADCFNLLKELLELSAPQSDHYLDRMGVPPEHLIGLCDNCHRVIRAAARAREQISKLELDLKRYKRQIVKKMKDTELTSFSGVKTGVKVKWEQRAAVTGILKYVHDRKYPSVLCGQVSETRRQREERQRWHDKTRRIIDKAYRNRKGVHESVTSQPPPPPPTASMCLDGDDDVGEDEVTPPLLSGDPFPPESDEDADDQMKEEFHRDPLLPDEEVAEENDAGEAEVTRPVSTFPSILRIRSTPQQLPINSKFQSDSKSMSMPQYTCDLCKDGQVYSTPTQLQFHRVEVHLHPPPSRSHQLTVSSTESQPVKREKQRRKQTFSKSSERDAFVEFQEAEKSFSGNKERFKRTT